MKLETLKINFLDMSPEDQQVFFTKYLERRNKDLRETAIVKTVSRSKGRTTEKKITVSTEAFELLKKLGLTK